MLVDKHDGDDELLAGIVADAGRKYTVFPGLFNGLAGLGNFLLDCHQLLHDDSYLTTAREIARGIQLFAVERPTGIAFPGDFLTRLSMDYGMGSAGIATMFYRLINGSRNQNFVLDSLLVLASEMFEQKTA